MNYYETVNYCGIFHGEVGLGGSWHQLLALTVMRASESSVMFLLVNLQAVACLEGNKCLVRAGVPLQDEDAADTSVACDSCDRW